MCEWSKRIEIELGVTIDCYGFDTGKGMPQLEGYKDLPYWFRANQYAMDESKLRSQIPEAKLVIGEIKDTIDPFIRDGNIAPIGAIMNDVDYYSSTFESFRLFDYVETKPDCFLPRLFMYFDDIIGSETEMYCEANGQLAAIAQFNKKNNNAKIHLNQNLLPNPALHYRWQIYYAHFFNHPSYDRYIGGTDQLDIEQNLRL